MSWGILKLTLLFDVILYMYILKLWKQERQEDVNIDATTTRNEILFPRNDNLVRKKKRTIMVFLLVLRSVVKGCECLWCLCFDHDFFMMFLRACIYASHFFFFVFANDFPS